MTQTGEWRGSLNVTQLPGEASLPGLPEAASHFLPFGWHGISMAFQRQGGDFVLPSPADPPSGQQGLWSAVSE